MEEEEDGTAAVPSFSGNPLLRAVFLRRLRLTRLLLEGGAYINESDGRGQTPLMVACGTRHADAQSGSRAKLVQYLLERGADPDIQDKAGRSALMHACLERAGAPVVSLLLASGADPGLEDRSGTSALVYAVTAGDQEALKLLLDTCKARGKEVIIIGTDMFPCGMPRARQYLDVSPLAQVGTTASEAPASPSGIDLLAAPQPGSSGSPKRDLFSFREATCSGCSGLGSHPCSPSRLGARRGPGRADAVQQPLHRLNSEPWLKIPASLLSRQPRAGPSSSTENLPDLSAEEDLSFRRDRQGWNAGRCCDHDGTPRRADCSVAGGGEEGGGGGGGGAPRGAGAGEGKRRGDLLGHNMCSLGLLSSHSASHPNLHSQSLGGSSASPLSSSCSSSSSPAGKTLGSSLHNMAMSSLQSIIQRRKLGADHYSSDPQLAAPARGLADDSRGPPESRRTLTSRSSTLLGSRESLEAPSLPRRVLSGALERRGSGALLLDHISQSRPGSLPPLYSRQTPIPNINEGGGGGGSCSSPSLGGRGGIGGAGGAGSPKTLLPAAPPGHPKELSRRTLLRRYSMQAEQLKQLGDFDGICSH